jgi:hypothetical protein
VNKIIWIIYILNLYKIPYTILEEGEFTYPTLQTYYNHAIKDGSTLKKALYISIRAEEVDIYDLQNIINKNDNILINDILRIIQCGSRNHLRSFYGQLKNRKGEYSPKFLSQLDFDNIINSNFEMCGWITF